MKKNPKCLIVVRHGHYSSDDSPLSTLGEKQIKSLRLQVLSFLENHLIDIGSARFLTFSFSGLKRAFQTAKILSDWKTDIVVKNLYLTTREEINPKLAHIFGDVMSLAGFYEADVVIVVAHGEMVPALAEIAGESLRNNKQWRLNNVVEGCGYLVNLETGEIFLVQGQKASLSLRSIETCGVS